MADIHLHSLAEFHMPTAMYLSITQMKPIQISFIYIPFIHLLLDNMYTTWGLE